MTFMVSPYRFSAPAGGGAITAAGPGGTANTGSSTTTLALTTTAAVNAASDHFAILTCAHANRTTTDGDNSEISSVTGLTGTWTKLAEYTNSEGSVDAGACVSVWLFVPSAANASGGTVTITYATTTGQKAASLHVFSGAGIQKDTSAAVQNSEVSAANDFGSSTLSGLSNIQRLYFRGLAKQFNSSTQITPTANFTAITNARSQNTSAAMKVCGEFRINTSTGETSNPTLANAGDTAGVFLALKT